MLRVAVSCVWPAVSDVSGRFCSSPSSGVQGDTPPFKARIGLSQTVVAPGGALRIRLENMGARDLSYDLAYELARRVHGSWTKLPTGPFLPLGMSCALARPPLVRESIFLEVRIRAGIGLRRSSGPWALAALPLSSFGQPSAWKGLLTLPSLTLHSKSLCGLIGPRTSSSLRGGEHTGAAGHQPRPKRLRRSPWRLVGQRSRI